ncbi:actin-like ATPase domain-containing protein [Hesseltinella vesiculosa]|uniref:Phosphotransferase n=1 Tax=Hesseltinella vesiculosa TaxID=101127 RepID=A0A1X2GVV0_9FUNG|nr:actin-like ATPase domain-containing protein [Hesseltinella vesiculosa]
MLTSIQTAFNIDQDQFKAIVDGFNEEYTTGLNTAEAKGLATMIPSFVTRLPTGQEQGTYLALDLGGSTLRVCAVELLGKGKVNVDEVKRTIGMTDPLRTGQVEPFFDWMADTVAMLLEKQHLDPAKPLSMGVSWSFPVDQTSLSDGTLLRMGKGFELQEMVGRDLKTLFHDAFQRKNLNVKVTALINDTVGVLVAHAYARPGTRVGFIFGTGTNAAYPEKVSKLIKLKDAYRQQGGDMLVNTEIDIFGNEQYLPLNEYDQQLDAQHTQPKFQLYEKMMSGGYLGELVRLICLQLIQQKQLFDGYAPSIFNQRYQFDTAYLSDLEGRDEQNLDDRLQYLQEILTWEQDVQYSVTEQDWQTLLDVCRIVATRSAKLAAAAIASLIEQQADTLDLANEQNDQPIIIGINGSTYELYPQMHGRMMDALSAWFGANVVGRIALEPARDGASIGGALIAMLYDEQANSPKR